ncbi:hypothetical protein BDV93DRAFT_545660 [Ceratobasidium sp. AG-I]|nr:hypothetical protein BDV93DRAFT_545660 [Ceratobasidium sp. AG-I]
MSIYVQTAIKKVVSSAVVWVLVVVLRHQDDREGPTHSERHLQVVPDADREGQVDVQVAEPQDIAVDIVLPEAGIPMEPITLAFEGGQVVNAIQTPLLKSLRGFEGILQTED